jgi:Flp pilus assembly protein TadG
MSSRVAAHRSRRRPARNRFGAAAVEAAIILPLLLTFLIGLWEVGRMVWVATVLTNAAREGGRIAAGGVYAGNPVTVAMVQQQVKDYLSTAGFPSAAVTGATVTLTNLSSNSWTDPSDAWPLDHYRVTIAIPSGNAYSSLQFSPVSTITGTTSLTVSSDWLSANDSRVTVSGQLPY